jgi:hypothetical protein
VNLFLTCDWIYLKTISAIQYSITKFHNNLHVPPINTRKFEKGASISGIKVFSHLPQSAKNLANDEKSFKFVLKRLLFHHSFLLCRSNGL